MMFVKVTLTRRERFTVADVMMGSVVGQYGRAAKFDFEPWPYVQAWVNLATKRAAFYPPREMKIKPGEQLATRVRSSNHQQLLLWGGFLEYL